MISDKLLKSFFTCVFLIVELFVASDCVLSQAPEKSLPKGIKSLFAHIVPGPAEAATIPGLPSDYSVDEKSPSAYLVVGAELDPGWSLYSVRQKAGGLPTEIKFDTSGNPAWKLGSFSDASSVTPVEFMNNILLKMKGKTLWIAPLFSVDNKTVFPQGTFKALVCLDGENGTCVPVSETLKPTWRSDLDVMPLLRNVAQMQQQPKDSTQVTVPKTQSETTSKVDFSFSFILYAFLGGLILNVMPCVLPVIGLKIVSFFEQAGHSRIRALTLNLWYTAGILFVFATLALMSVGLSCLFTYGLFQIVMGTIVFAMALSLMGLWELKVPSFLGSGRSSQLMQQEGSLGAFFKGIITTLLAIPCGAPLLSPALVWSDSMIQQDQTGLVLAVYLVIGLGMASPYLVVGAFPELLRFLPKPGLWMETFRIAMGYVLLTAVVWILFSMPLVLILPMIALLFALWFACWLIGRLPFDASWKYRGSSWSIALIVLAITILFSFNVPGIGNPYTLENAIQGKMIRWAVRAQRQGLLESNRWSLFDTKLFRESLENNKPVMIDFTADWCMNCKLLESTVLHTSEIDRFIDQKGIVTMTADWTNQNDPSGEMKTINELLDRYGGRQVPTIMVFDPRYPEEPAVLRGLFTSSELISILEKLK